MAALTLFYSYAPEDKALRDQLETHLAPLEDQGLISTWHDHKIPPGNARAIVSLILAIATIIDIVTKLPNSVSSYTNHNLPATLIPLSTPTPTANPAGTDTAILTSLSQFIEDYCDADIHQKWYKIYNMETTKYQQSETLDVLEHQTTPHTECRPEQPQFVNVSKFLYPITFFPSNNSQPHTYAEIIILDNGAWKIDASLEIA